MKQIAATLVVMLLATLDSVATTLNFNPNWAYQLGDVANGEQVDLDDSTWVPVTIPHTLAVALMPICRAMAACSMPSH